MTDSATVSCCDYSCDPHRPFPEFTHIDPWKLFSGLHSFCEYFISAFSLFYCRGRVIVCPEVIEM